MSKGIVYALILAGLSSCAFPTYMEVHEGVSPEYRDEQVRFRTTYYFRVVDTCSTETDKVQSDSLYRFRMTGKSGALGSKVRFESGILHKDVIDPFGVDIKKLSTSNNQKEQIILPKESNAACANGSGSVNRSFEVMGPQGTAYFDQDYRLIVAMSSDSTPLIQAMNFISSRILGKEDANSSELLLPLIQEQLNIAHANGVSEGKSAEGELTAIIKAYDGGGE